MRGPPATVAHGALLYATICLTGAAVLLVEIAGARVLTPFYGSSIYVWSSTITVTLASLSVGYVLGGFLADRRPSATWFYGLIFLGGLFTLVPIKLNQPILVATDALGFRAGSLVAALLLFAPSLVLLSTTGPYVIRLRTRRVERAGHEAGLVFGVSTVGSLAGALLTGFYVVPNFRLSSIFLATSCGLMGLGLVGLLAERAGRGSRLAAGAGLLGALALPFVPGEERPVVEILRHESSVYADVKVGERRNEQGQRERALFMDGGAHSTITVPGGVFPPYVYEIQRLSAGWPARSRILLLGVGGGGFASVLQDRFAVDMVEIDPKIAAMARDDFGLAPTADDRLFLEDARAFLRRTEDRYDVIVTDLVLGTSLPIHLFTVEAFELLRSRLTPHGLLVTNVVAFLDDPRGLAACIVKTIHEVFPGSIVTGPRFGGNNHFVHSSLRRRYRPGFTGGYVPVPFDFRAAQVATDSRNPLELLTARHADVVRGIRRRMYGYAPQFGVR